MSTIEATTRIYFVAWHYSNGDSEAGGGGGSVWNCDQATIVAERESLAKGFGDSLDVLTDVTKTTVAELGLTPNATKDEITAAVDRMAYETGA